MRRHKTPHPKADFVLKYGKLCKKIFKENFRGSKKEHIKEAHILADLARTHYNYSKTTGTGDIIKSLGTAWQWVNKK